MIALSEVESKTLTCGCAGEQTMRGRRTVCSPAIIFWTQLTNRKHEYGGSHFRFADESSEVQTPPTDYATASQQFSA